MLVVIDAGHGPNTAGKRAPDGSMREYHFNGTVAWYIDKYLKEYENTRVIFTHSDSRDVPLSERCSVASNSGANAFISIHANAHGAGDFTDANGVEAFTLNKNNATANKLADLIISNICKIKGQRNRGHKTANFQVIGTTNKVPVRVLVEAGFMTNRTELAYLKDEGYRAAVGRAIVDALVAIYGLKKKVTYVAPAPPAKELYVVSGAFGARQNADDVVKLLTERGIHAFIEER